MIEVSFFYRKIGQPFKYTVARSLNPIVSHLSATIDSFESTRYHQSARDEDLPARANCVTAVRSFLQKAANLQLPHGYIGDLPYLLSLREWRILRVSTLKPGDLIFRGYENGYLEHIAIAVSSDSVFHCAWKRNIVIEPVDQFFKLDRGERQSPQGHLINRDHRSYHYRPLPE
jgi:hypothetical protein